MPLLIVYGVVVAAMALLFARLPTAFLPEEDQGIMIALFNLPTGATLDRTLAVGARIRTYFVDNERANIHAIFDVAGFNFAGNGQNLGQEFIRLNPWDDRHGARNHAPAIAQRGMRALSNIRDAQVFILVPPAVQELGNSTGFDVELEDRGGLGHQRLLAARNQFLGMASQDPILAGVRPNGQEDTPQLNLAIDEARAGALGLSLADVNDTLSTASGGEFVNNFIDRGRVKKVYMQGDAPYRSRPEDLGLWRVRGATPGTMAPFKAPLPPPTGSLGPAQLQRYNGLPAMDLQGQSAPGKSSGAAIAEIRKIMAKLPPGIGFELTGISYQEQLAGSQAPALLGLSMLVVFLCLAALYESWSIPVAVMLIVPLGVFGALLAATLRGFYNDIYFQVGLLTTIGLSAKNAILIVQFADEAEKSGETPGGGSSGPAGGAAPPAAHPDDLAGLRRRRAASGDLQRGGGGEPERHRHRGHRRGAGGDDDGDLLRALVLRRSAPPLPQAGEAGGRAGGVVRRTFVRALSVATLGMAAVTLGACIDLAPTYRRPQLPTPAAFPAGAAYSPPPATVQPVGSWRDFFADPRLKTVIAQALANNRDLRIALANVAAARGQYVVQRSNQFPKLDATASATYGQTPLSVLGGGAFAAGQSRVFNERLGEASGRASAPGSWTFSASCAIKPAPPWTPIFETREARDAAQITLIGEVASRLAGAGPDRALLANARDTQESGQATVDLTRARFTSGVASALDVAQAETVVQQARSDVARFTTQIAQDRNALELVVGAPVADDLLPPDIDNDGVVLARLPAGLPASVLLTRPDVVEAEDQLKAANANIGAARAAFFPDISLTGSGRVIGFGAVDAVPRVIVDVELRPDHHPADLRLRGQPGKPRSGQSPARLRRRHV